MLHSAVLIIPAAMKAQADAVGAALGWGPVSFTIPLGDGGDVTHYGARADVSVQFVRWIRGHEPLPDPAFAPVIDALIADFSPDPGAEGMDTAAALWGRAHLTDALRRHGFSDEEAATAPG